MPNESLWELKESAKWSSNPVERMDAVKKLSARGAEALPSLEEILNVTAYEDIRAACTNAIKSLGKARDASAGKQPETVEEKKPETKLADLPP